MNKKYITLGILALVIVTAGATAYAMNKNSWQEDAVLGTSEIKIPTTHYVDLTDDKAVPAELLIKIGEYVQFDSKDGKTHNISSGKGNDYGNTHEHTATSSKMSGDQIESGPFGADEGFKVFFARTGTYYFHDHMDADITITVAVYDPSKKE
ncbi:MAG: hypothetical protein V4519_03545 [Patescibacteria group bacterium]